jgi:hypothetical protein
MDFFRALKLWIWWPIKVGHYSNYQKWKLYKGKPAAVFFGGPPKINLEHFKIWQGGLDSTPPHGK